MVSVSDRTTRKRVGMVTVTAHAATCIDANAAAGCHAPQDMAAATFGTNETTRMANAVRRYVRMGSTAVSAMIANTTTAAITRNPVTTRGSIEVIGNWNAGGIG